MFFYFKGVWKVVFVDFVFVNDEFIIVDYLYVYCNVCIGMVVDGEV